MKICYLGDGDSMHIKRWCVHFASLGHEVHLITYKNSAIEGTRIHFINAGEISVKGGNWKFIFKIGTIKKILKEIKPDILHAHYATSYGFTGALTGYHPFIVSALGTDVLISPKKSWVYKFLVRYVFKKADWITAMADHMRQAIIDLGISSAKISTVIFGVNSSLFNHERRTLPADKFIISSTRNLEPVYNLELLIKAVGLVKDKIPNLQLHIAGYGSQRDMLERLVVNLGLSDRTKFWGRYTPEFVSDLLNKTHLFVTTSLSDGNNISLNEAMACGTVSLATDIPANRQWIAEGVNGFLVPLHDEKYLAEKILYVYKNYNELQKNAIKYNDKIIGEKATWAKNMALVEEKYKQLSGKK